MPPDDVGCGAGARRPPSVDCAGRLRRLLEQRPAVCDGGVTTELQALGLPPGQGGERWNLDEPGAVRSVHQEYLDAGADLLTTNTFGGTSLALRRGGAEAGLAAALAGAGARLAREVAGERALVLGDVGPFGGRLGADAERAEVARAFRDQVRALLDGGVDAILIETMSDPLELALAVGVARAEGARSVLATAAFGRGADGFRTLPGAGVAEVVGAALDAGADVVGANCGIGLSLEDWIALVAELHAAARGRTVLVRPSAGSPALVAGGALAYPVDPAAFAAAVPRLLAAGARLVGGCCGTGPAHVAAIAAVVGATDPGLGRE